MHPAEKHLNEMNRLADMLHFPVLVNAGATANVMIHGRLDHGTLSRATRRWPASGLRWCLR